MKKLIDIILRFLGFRTQKSEDEKWLEEKIKRKEQELEKIDEENPSIDDISNHFNK